MQSTLALTIIIELALNELFFSANYSDPQINAARLRLNGKVLSVELKALSKPIILVFSRRQVDVLTEWAGDINCAITASPSVLLKLSERQNITSLIKHHELDVDGDIDVLRQIVALAELVNWDLADYLSPYTGDILAYGVSHHIQLSAAFMKKLFYKQQNNFQEVMKEEWLMLPTHLQLAHLSDRIAELDQDIELFSNRVEKLNSDDETL